MVGRQLRFLALPGDLWADPINLRMIGRQLGGAERCARARLIHLGMAGWQRWRIGRTSRRSGRRAERERGDSDHPCRAHVAFLHSTELSLTTYCSRTFASSCATVWPKMG